MKGLQVELDFSKKYHQQFTPVLVSSLWSKRNNLAQIDLAYMDHGVVQLIEVKSSKIGIDLFYRKRERLLKAQKFLTYLFPKGVKLRAVTQNILPKDQLFL